MQLKAILKSIIAKATIQARAPAELLIVSNCNEFFYHDGEKLGQLGKNSRTSDVGADTAGPLTISYSCAKLSMLASSSMWWPKQQRATMWSASAEAYCCTETCSSGQSEPSFPATRPAACRPTRANTVTVRSPAQRERGRASMAPVRVCRCYQR